MYKGRYFVISSGGLGTEAMVIFPPDVEVQTVERTLMSEVHNDRVVSSGMITFKTGDPYCPALAVVCDADSEYNDREGMDQKVAEKTFRP